MDNQLDPQVVNLARAIRQTESGGNYSASGLSKEKGGYQFTPDTWNAVAPKYGINVPIDQATPEQQNAVAYNRIKEWKDSGHDVTQIASMWNAGEGEPNAYTGRFGSTTPTHKAGDPSVGVNRFGAKYDVPAYVESVANAYQQFKAGNQNPDIIPNPSTVAADQNQQPTDPNQPTGDWLDKLTGVVNAVFPGKQVGQNIGTLLGYLGVKAYDALNGTDLAKNYDLSAPTPLQTLGDVAQGALMVGTGLPEGEAVNVFGKAIPTLPEMGSLGRIATNSALGAGFGATGAVAGGETNPGEILKQGALGGVIGGVAGVAGEGLSKLADALPRRLISSALPKIQTEGLNDYALKNLKFGTLDSMLNTSQESLNHYENQVSTILNHPDYKNEFINGDTILKGVMNAFPNSEYTLENIVNKLKTQVPSEAATLTRLFKGEDLGLEEANTLRKAIDKTTYKLTIDSPEVKAGKDLAAVVGNTLRKEIQTKAPEVQGVFSNYSKEVNLFKALKKAAKVKTGRSVITFKDLYGIIGGGLLGGIPGSVAGAVAENIASRPAVKIAAAKTLAKLAPVAKTVAGATKIAGAMIPGRISANQ